MKTVIISLIILWMFTLASAGTAIPASSPASNDPAPQSAQPSAQIVSSPAPTSSGHSQAILSRAEADSLSIRGERQLAESGVGSIQVGSIDSGDLIYVLVVVLLVVVIIAVIR
jgi:hypothetical protein